MNTDSSDRPYQLEDIDVGGGLDEFGYEDGGQAGGTSTFEVVEAEVALTPPAPPRRTPLRHKMLRAAARTVVAATVNSCRQSGAATAHSCRRATVSTVAAVSRLAVSACHRAHSAAALGVVRSREFAATLRASAHEGRRTIGAAAFTLCQRVRRHLSPVFPAPRRAVGALAAAGLAGLVLVSWNQRAGLPVASLPPSMESRNSHASADAFAASASATAPTPAVIDAAPLAPTAGTRLGTPTVAVAQRLAAPEPVAAYVGTVSRRAEPVNQPPVVLASTGAVPAAVQPLTEAVVPAAVVPAALPSTEGPDLAAADATVVERPSGTTALDSLAADHSAIEDVLSSYRRSYNALDAKAVSAIWQGVDTRALARAFSTLNRQHMLFERCTVRVTQANRGVARCDGFLSYVPKAGDTSTRQRRVSWDIDFRRPAGMWVIVGVQAR